MDAPLSPIALAELARKATTVAGRLSIVQEQAQRVFGRSDEVEAWMAHYNPAVMNGLCPVSLACQNPEGFRQAMAELGRIAGRRTRMGWIPANDSTAEQPETRDAERSA